MSTAIIVFELRFGFYNDALCFIVLITKKTRPTTRQLFLYFQQHTILFYNFLIFSIDNISFLNYITSRKP